MNKALVFQDVPAEIVPSISPPLALFICVPQPTLDISLADVDWRRPVIQNVDTLAALSFCRNVLDVFRVSGPHFTAAFHQSSLALLAATGSHKTPPRP